MKPPKLTLIALLALFLASCFAAPPPPAGKPSGKAQPKLPTIKLRIDSHAITAEVADDAAEMERGLMFREKLGEYEGMLFIYPSPRQLSFWMKNTSIPLDIAYIAADGTILEIHPMQPFDEASVTSRSQQAIYALEMNQGWFSKHNIKPGTTVSFHAPDIPAQTKY